MDEVLGGAAGGVAQTITGYPFDTVKVHQVAKEINSPWRAFKHLLRTEGMHGLYRGVYSPMVGAVVINAHTFFMYNGVKKFAHQSLGLDGEWPRLIAGGSVGFTLTVWEAPVEIVKIHMQLNPGMTYRRAMREVDMFRGFWATAARNVYALWAVFAGYEEVKHACIQSGTHPYIGSFLGGAVGGFICWVPAYPIDFIKTRIQAYESWRGLPWRHYWRGLTPCAVRAAFVNPFIFLAYDVAMDYIKKD